MVARVLGNAQAGTFTSLRLTKKGELKGRGDERKRYGDDEVSVVVVTGFNYTNLIRKSVAALETLTNDVIRDRVSLLAT
jgi:hypothetical protein